jgi:hypothetical protein
MEPLQPGQNPRDVMPNHRERGPKEYVYTVESVAAAAGRAVTTVRQDSGPRLAKSPKGVEMSDLLSVARYVQRHAVAGSRLLTDEEAMDRLEIDCPADLEQRRRDWVARWPRFEAYGCAATGCREVLLEAGFCPAHGGARRPSLILYGDYFNVLVADQYQPFHRLILGSPPGLDVHHIDENKWNNRPTNLEALTHAEHWRRHNGLGFNSRRRSLRSEPAGAKDGPTT